jgi:diguanylate cyclase (GGDEF)-like protein/PAS domain S-box-containing protein
VGATDEPAQRPRICRLSKDARAAIVDVDPAVEQMLGWRPEDLLGRRHLDFVHPDDGPVVVETWITLLSRPGTPQHLRLRQRCRDGSYMWVEVINHNRLQDPDHGDVACDVIDISEQVAAEQALREREEMLDKLTHSLPSGVAQFDRAGRLLYSNSRLFDILGTAAVQSVSELLVNVESESHDDLLGGVLAVCDELERREIESRVCTPGSPDRVCQFVVSPLSGGATGAVLSVTDITDTAARRAELEHQATTDPLTQCHNRTAIMEALVEALAAAGPDRGVAALFVDLDGFKLVNDALGHAAGDEMLRIVADRLCSATRGGDVVGRFGGDEFLVLHPDVRTHSAAEELADRLGEALCQPAMINDQPVVPSASIGVAWSDGSHDADELVRRADAAMYAVKAARQPGDSHKSTPGNG